MQGTKAAVLPSDKLPLLLTSQRSLAQPKDTHKVSAGGMHPLWFSVCDKLNPDMPRRTLLVPHPPPAQLPAVKLELSSFRRWLHGAAGRGMLEVTSLALWVPGEGRGEGTEQTAEQFVVSVTNISLQRSVKCSV